MDIRKLEELDVELDRLEMSYDVALESSLEDKKRLLESHFKLRDIVRKNTKWRKELMAYLKSLPH